MEYEYLLGPLTLKSNIEGVYKTSKTNKWHLEFDKNFHFKWERISGMMETAVGRITYWEGGVLKKSKFMFITTHGIPYKHLFQIDKGKITVELSSNDQNTFVLKYM